MFWLGWRVGVGATKGLLRGPEYREQPASEGSLIPAKKNTRLCTRRNVTFAQWSKRCLETERGV